jgi:hypothetical protein
MTAEIAILNRTAVALAADSIVTLAGPRSSKTYDSAEKIFQLSRYQPIGLMIYNNALFMNAPLEILVRRYRETVTTVGFAELVQVWPAFETFLLSFKRENDDELEHFQGMIRAEFSQFGDLIVKHMLEGIGKKKKKGAETASELLARRVEERTAEAAALRQDPPFLEDVTLPQFVDIDRRGDTAAVVPFAQKDMPQRFILGIDRQFEGALEKIADSMVSDVVGQCGSSFDPDQAELIRTAASRQFKDGLDRLKRNSEQTLKTVVNHMSKKELGEVAFSLVELTSRKRRYSTDMETVGGPIDVAILTRNEGFVWVKRKHYFDADLNPQYTPR